ncbi:hypothetical protein [Nocardioides sp. GXZ039]|uniref:hypothetical protein n=1 Tax=Nocardioides sp. GXZ039 TaxID=3136018 RepID=UPI0030F43864
MTTRATPVLITYDGVLVRHLLTPATSAHHIAALQTEAEAQIVHRAACRESCERLSGTRDPLQQPPAAVTRGARSALGERS